MDAPFRDDNNEDQMQQIIYASARWEGSGGEDYFSSQFLNDFGEGLQFEDEVTLTTHSVEVFIYIKAVLITIYICINWSVLHVLTNHFF